MVVFFFRSSLVDFSGWLPSVSFSQALEAEDKRVKQVEALLQLDERKRPYNSLGQVKAPTEEEMEAFRMKRCRPDDPMASFLGQWWHYTIQPFLKDSGCYQSHSSVKPSLRLLLPDNFFVTSVKREMTPKTCTASFYTFFPQSEQWIQKSPSVSTVIIFFFIKCFSWAKISLFQSMFLCNLAAPAVSSSVVWNINSFSCPCCLSLFKSFSFDFVYS